MIHIYIYIYFEPLIKDPRGRAVRGRGGRFNRRLEVQGGVVLLGGLTSNGGKPYLSLPERTDLGEIGCELIHF